MNLVHSVSCLLVIAQGNTNRCITSYMQLVFTVRVRQNLWSACTCTLYCCCSGRDRTCLPRNAVIIRSPSAYLRAFCFQHMQADTVAPHSTHGGSLLLFTSGVYDMYVPAPFVPINQHSTPDACLFLRCLKAIQTLTTNAAYIQTRLDEWMMAEGAPSPNRLDPNGLRKDNALDRGHSPSCRPDALGLTHNQGGSADLPVRPELGSIADSCCASYEKHLWKDGGGRLHPWTSASQAVRAGQEPEEGGARGT